MARKERVVIDRLNGASEVQQIHGMPNNLGFPTIIKRLYISDVDS